MCSYCLDCALTEVISPTVGATPVADVRSVDPVSFSRNFDRERWSTIARCDRRPGTTTRPATVDARAHRPVGFRPQVAAGELRVRDSSACQLATSLHTGARQAVPAGGGTDQYLIGCARNMLGVIRIPVAGLRSVRSGG